MNKKTINILYWITIVLFGVFMLMAGVTEAIQHPSGKEIMDHLGYAHFNLTVLGIGKILGAIALLLPPTKFLIAKEWAYAGFTITFLGALVARYYAHDDIMLIVSPLLFMAFMFITYALWKAKLKTNA